jgi:protoporphyrinogen IX oxidase
VNPAWAGAYLWLKALHIISVIAWMAGLLYLPRLFVYHAMAPPGSDRSEVFKVMERRLERAIMTPAMLATYVFGLSLAATPGLVDWHDGWIWAKLALVLGLTVFHMALMVWRRAFAEDRNRHSPRFFRVANEIPSAAIVVIVFLVVLKPF